MKRCISLLLATLFLASCGNKSEDESTSSSSITISGAVSTASALTARSKSVGAKAVDLSTLAMYCVAFNEAATSDQSEFGASGEFSLEMPADTPFGCFVVQQSNLSIVATVTIEDSSQQDLAGNDVKSTSMSLGSSVSLGNLVITEGSTEIVVPATRIASAISNKAPDLEVDDLHNTSWTLSCLDSSDAACAAFIIESPEVFFRIVKATKASETVYGLGVWASEDFFNDCGGGTGKDFSTAEAQHISDEGYTWVQHTAGNFNPNVTNCTLRDSDGSYVESPETYEGGDLAPYYTMNKLVLSGNTFTLHEEEEETYTGLGGNPCTEYEKFSVSFTPSGASTLYGQFESTEKVSGEGCDPEDIGSETSSFKVKFTKQ